MSDLLEDEDGAPYPPHVQEVLEALEAERDALAARVAAVEALHVTPIGGSWCRQCGSTWPCRTVAALALATAAAEGGA